MLNIWSYGFDLFSCPFWSNVPVSQRDIERQKNKERERERGDRKREIDRQIDITKTGHFGN